MFFVEIIEDVPSAEGTEGQGLAVPPATLLPHNPEREAYKKLGLTKQVLAAHTQKEEQTFLSRFRELRGVHAFKADCSLYLEKQKGQVTSEGKEGFKSKPEVEGSCVHRNFPFAACVIKIVYNINFKFKLTSEYRIL